ncbi:hypothetical protein ACMU_07890 [Actibacterium mucosum KCTC 23349]|uniref:DUF6311 domain-containing protein n=1 Tax=Actibacterium mucosum KCTC 23349 TaxID=1454373 RepID=A0A037ZKA2_9RHOB|nr:DUF6311 domain-containing protein [Actibacterium mucosum]KAJ56851.1 hypothetical protein ACMU_07890 [Actibacterium mucosum KCTC 23349]
MLQTLYRRHRLALFHCAFCGLLIGIAFLRFFDVSILNPTNIGWIDQGDLRQHYLGWQAFRQAETPGTPWGTAPLLAYPHGTPISATDSNPLVSLILWPMRNLLPVEFQFIGPWYLLCLSLSLVFGRALMRREGFDRWTATLLGAVLAFPPILFWRYGHDTLMAQWLILAAIYVSFAVTRPLRAGLAHGGLLLVAMMTHPYLYVMLSIVAGCDLALRILRQGGVRFGQVERVVLALIATQGLALYVGVKLGVFSLQNAFQNTVGLHSTDPLGFFNPFDSARLLPQLPSGSGQYEGYAYLGLGGLVLLGILLVRAIRGTLSLPQWRALLPVQIAALIAFLFALSPVITVLGREVFVWEMSPENPVHALFAKLRSSGRFVWVTIYVMMFTGLLCLAGTKPRRLRGIAVVLLGLQFWDLAPLADRSRTDTALRPVAAHMFGAPDWKARIARADYIYISRSLGPDFTLDLGAASIRAGTPISWFYTAQGLGLPKQIAAEEQLRIRILNGGHDDGALILADGAGDLPLIHRNAPGILTSHRFAGFHAVETPAFGPASYDAETHGLTDLLRDCNTGCTALLTVRDEGAAELSVEFKSFMAALGSAVPTLGLNDGYAAVLHHGALLAETLERDADAILNAQVAETPLSLRSSVEDARIPAAISVGGINFSRDQRGINLVLLHADGRITTANFDTHSTSDSLRPDVPEDLILASAPELATVTGPTSTDATPFVGLDRFLTRESSLLDVLSGCRQGCAMAISVKDEGAASLPLAVRMQAAQLGLTLADLSFRDGYSAIVENGIVLVQGKSADEVVDVAEIVEGTRMRVRSAGFAPGSLSSITLNGTEHSLNQRGVNIVVVLQDKDTIAYHFDTHGGF